MHLGFNCPSQKDKKFHSTSQTEDTVMVKYKISVHNKLGSNIVIKNKFNPKKTPPQTDSIDLK